MQRSIILVGLTVFAMGQTILFALLGPVAREIGLAEWQVGAIISASAIVFVLISPLWGTLADRWGRKNTIVSGLASYALTTLLFAWLLNQGMSGAIAGMAAFSALVGARLLYAVGSAGIQPAAVAMMADLTSRSDRSAGVALVGAAFGIGTVIGPGVAYAFVGFGLLVPLLVAAGAAMLLAVLAGIFVADPKRPADEDGSTASAKPDIRLLAPLLALAFGSFVAISALQQTMAFYIQDFTGSDAEETTRLAGNAFVILALAMLIIQGGVVQKLKPRPAIMMVVGFPLALAGIAVMAWAPTYWLIIVGFGIMGAGFGLVQPGINALVSLTVSAEAQGNAAGFVQAAMAGGFVIGPISGTLIYALSPKAPMLLAMTCCAICFIVFLWTQKMRPDMGDAAA